MKRILILPALILLAFTACKKESKTVTYRAECTGCHVEYVNGSHRWIRVSVSTVEHIDLIRLDTIINGIDTTLVDTLRTLIPDTWERTEELAHDEPARLKVRHASYATTPSTASITVNGGTVKSGEVSEAGNELSLEE